MTDLSVWMVLGGWLIFLVGLIALAVYVAKVEDRHSRRVEAAELPMPPRYVGVRPPAPRAGVDFRLVWR